MRTKLRDREIRVIFFFEGADMILTHGFVKKASNAAGSPEVGAGSQASMGSAA